MQHRKRACARGFDGAAWHHAVQGVAQSARMASSSTSRKNAFAYVCEVGRDNICVIPIT